MAVTNPAGTAPAPQADPLWRAADETEGALALGHRALEQLEVMAHMLRAQVAAKPGLEGALRDVELVLLAMADIAAVAANDLDVGLRDALEAMGRTRPVPARGIQ